MFLDRLWLFALFNSIIADSRLCKLDDEKDFFWISIEGLFHSKFEVIFIFDIYKLLLAFFVHDLRNW